MASTYKILGQSNPSATSLTDVYTVPGATQTIISSITVCNRSSTPTTFRLGFSPNGAGSALEHYVAYDADLLANEVWVWTVGVTLDAADVVRVYVNDATVSVNVFGEELT